MIEITIKLRPSSSGGRVTRMGEVKTYRKWVAHSIPIQTLQDAALLPERTWRLERDLDKREIKLIIVATDGKEVR